MTAPPADLSTVCRSAHRGSQELALPEYDRDQLSVGVVHFGVGGFHRAHEAMYLDRLMNAGEASDWAICGIGVMSADRKMQSALRAQAYLYTLVEKHADGHHRARVIGSVVDYLFAPDDPIAVVERLADESTRIVSLTITEGGYGIDDVTGEFDPRTPGVAEDLAPAAVPRGVFGLITAALARRRSRGVRPFSVVSCDNLQANGHVARRAVTSFARLRDPELGDWIESEVPFPCSMVDRITPATTDADRDLVRTRFGLHDLCPVVCEPYAQWVLQDSFASGRPAFERAGVQVVGDVEPHELLKLRLVNAVHQGLCYLGRLCDYELVHEAAQDPLFQQFLNGYMNEAIHTLPPVAGIDYGDYKALVIERLCNPGIGDTIARLCADGSDRIPKFLLPVVRLQLARGGAIRYSAAIVASWARYAEGADEHGEPIQVVDRRKRHLTALANAQRSDILAFVSNRELFGDLIDHQSFATAYCWALRSLLERGARATLTALVSPTGLHAE